MAAHRRKSQQGSVFTEGAIGLIVIIGLFGIFTDIGISLYRYSRIYRVVQDTTQQYSLLLHGDEASCEEIQEEIRTYATERIQQKYGVHGSYQFNPNFTLPLAPGSDDIRTVNMAGSWQLDCFLCIFTKPINLNVWAEQPIESPKFWCTSEA